MKRIMSVVLMAAVIVGAALGVSSLTSSPVKTTTTPTLSALCPPGASFMGCAAGAKGSPPSPNGSRVTPPAPGCVYPDVSSYQRSFTISNWRAASAHICAAVSKAGESNYIVDPYFKTVVGYFRALRIPWAPYWFVRGPNDGALFAHVLESVGYKGDPLALRPVLDIEVPSAVGSAVPVADVIHRVFGVWPIIYTAPGTWPGGNSGGLESWEADYTLAHSPERMPFTTTVLGWQRYSPPTTYYYVPGLGYIDESVDLRGFSKDKAFTPNPVLKPVVVFKTPIRVSRQRVVVLTVGCKNSTCTGTDKFVAEIGLGKSDPVIKTWKYDIQKGRQSRPEIVLSRQVYAVVRQHQVKIKVTGTSAGSLILVKE